MSNRPTVTAVVIALNEESDCRAGSAAVAWADERLVVDGGSTDATIEIARRAGARVAVRTFDFFTPQRNYALHQAACEWVMFVDADERPDARLGGRNSPPAAGLSSGCFSVTNSQLGFRPAVSLLGHAGRSARPPGAPHCAEWIGGVHTGLETPGPKGEMDGWIDHETMSDWASYWSKVERYTSLDAQLRVDAGRPPVWYAPWVLPVREVFRRLCWKQGWLDGPRGWAFCLASGLSEWELATKHRRLWNARQAGGLQTTVRAGSSSLTANWPRLGLSRLATR